MFHRHLQAFLRILELKRGRGREQGRKGGSRVLSFLLSQGHLVLRGKKGRGEMKKGLDLSQRFIL